MKYRVSSKIFGAAVVLLLAGTSLAQMQMGTNGEQKRPSPPAQAKVDLDGKAITIDYSAPSMRGRKIMGGLVPYGKVWRTGANEATTLKTSIPIHIGDLAVPAGTYTLYTIPSESGWKLIVNKQTGQWGTQYDEKLDLGRVPMATFSTTSPVETFTIHLEKTSGNQTELHFTWETTDVYIPVSAD
jgi:Protein of unknown function (DUF2911)